MKFDVSRDVDTNISAGEGAVTARPTHLRLLCCLLCRCRGSAL